MPRPRYSKRQFQAEVERCEADGRTLIVLKGLICAIHRDGTFWHSFDDRDEAYLAGLSSYLAEMGRAFESESELEEFRKRWLA